ncbi:(2Fe-2S) ferredoxin domain-containing protein [Ancylothrix sp. C2]|uniref:(2Fe-2S) ferredoxin domain-containing protein n=1 Tax=Ancylothrix sp. D3o TaxID=2953691 RepID=UPI0021BBAC9C|nr:(2Fe-2S) ferredoxin domain-containing protein [Ancylothrix sp. D3o]MCT7952021.1 (2Fe-2S) ferredoxin domain-containing protein [Ancylothrix sp. D3o]
MVSDKEILICQNRTCRKQGSAKVMAAFQVNAVPNITLTGSGCLGKCGNGPMVLILPDQVWYSHVHPSEAPALINRHL